LSATPCACPQHHVLVRNTNNQSPLYIYCRAALSLRGTVEESSRHGVWESLLYAIKKLDGEEEKKCKGVKRNVIRNRISFNDYKDVLFSGKEVLRAMNVIRSRQHNLSTEQVNKIALSANDDKRIIQPNKIQTLDNGFRG